MTIRKISYALIIAATSIVILSLFALALGMIRWQRSSVKIAPSVVAVRESALQTNREVAQLPTPAIMVGTPELYQTTTISSRYTYRNERNDPNQLRSLHLIDTESGQELRLGDDSHAATFGTMNEEYVLWFFWGEGIHAYELATGEDRLIHQATSTLTPQIAGDWIGFGQRNQPGRDISHTLFVANLQTNEVITLTRALDTRGDGYVDLYYGISESLVAWYERPDTIVIYDLNQRAELTRLEGIDAVFDELVRFHKLTPGETVLTWAGHYGYDLVTQSYFRIEQRLPPDWDSQPIRVGSRITEQDRVLLWDYTMQDGTRRYVRAPLLDATPSAAPCINGQNLVQNGDLESTADHSLWQQVDSPSNLIVNEFPSGSPQSGQWAMRLGRYYNADQSIQQTIHVPSHVKELTLTFDVRALSWDFWGGDRLQIDLVDPLTGNSLLEQPVQWTNVQLASGGWLPMQVTIEQWPGINTPVDLVFQVQTDWALPSDFTVDNIQLMTTCQ